MDNRFGVVAKVTARYVIVRGFDGVEAVVPNETLVTTTVLNHSYSDREIRMAVNVQVGYDTDVEHALKLMEAAGMAEPRVLKTPYAPAAFLARFAEGGIELELGVWINDPEKGQLNLRSSIQRAIWNSFRANGIKIPFAPRDLRVPGPSGPAGGTEPTPDRAGPAA